MYISLPYILTIVMKMNKVLKMKSFMFFKKKMKNKCNTKKQKSEKFFFKFILLEKKQDAKNKTDL